MEMADATLCRLLQPAAAFALALPFPGAQALPPGPEHHADNAESGRHTGVRHIGAEAQAHQAEQHSQRQRHMWPRQQCHGCLQCQSGGGRQVPGQVDGPQEWELLDDS